MAQVILAKTEVPRHNPSPTPDHRIKKWLRYKDAGNDQEFSGIPSPLTDNKRQRSKTQNMAA
ncbi:hypothetical protein [Pseudomonas sp. DSP3-2-2]|uniref:hypothetical protein n=1 Tax=unclassified Pseudomonas TaxID=196821 RepID=UPI003CEC673B